jgi:hypothetical protein
VRTLAAIAILLSLAGGEASAQLQPGPNLWRGFNFTFSPRARYIGPPVPIAVGPPPVVALPPPAGNPVIHNGSLMTVEALGQGRVVIRYVEPRPGLWEVGVRPGTLLIEGRWEGKTLKATAFAFPPFPCPPVPYVVRGGVGEGNVLTLVGPAPLIDPYACAVVGMVWSNNSTLVFVPAK